VHGEPGEQQRDLAQDRDAGALGHHQQEHAERSEACDQPGHLPEAMVATRQNGAGASVMTAVAARIRVSVSILRC
jgi:hypothetical protein